LAKAKDLAEQDTANVKERLDQRRGKIDLRKEKETDERTEKWPEEC